MHSGNDHSQEKKKLDTIVISITVSAISLIILFCCIFKIYKLIKNSCRSQNSINPLSEQEESRQNANNNGNSASLILPSYNEAIASIAAQNPPQLPLENVINVPRIGVPNENPPEYTQIEEAFENTLETVSSPTNINIEI